MHEMRQRLQGNTKNGAAWRKIKVIQSVSATEQDLFAKPRQ